MSRLGCCEDPQGSRPDCGQITQHLQGVPAGVREGIYGGQRLWTGRPRKEQLAMCSAATTNLKSSSTHTSLYFVLLALRTSPYTHTHTPVAPLPLFLSWPPCLFSYQGLVVVIDRCPTKPWWLCTESDPGLIPHPL